MARPNFFPLVLLPSFHRPGQHHSISIKHIQPPNMSYRVRFAKIKQQGESSASPTNPTIGQRELGPRLPQHPETPPSRSYSKFGCKECKSRRVKCDETFPTCLRCRRRGTLCLAAARPTQWLAEMPSIMLKSVQEPWPGAVNPNKRLLHNWLNNTSRMMALSPTNNPLSLPLVRHLLSTPSLVHAVQCLSAGEEGFFEPPTLRAYFRERGLAIQALRHELEDSTSIKPSSVLTVFLLGISASWTKDKPDDYGKEHLSAARILLNRMLAEDRHRDDLLVQYIIGWYLYWDMTCAFIAEPDDTSCSYATEMPASMRSMLSSFHPMIGFSAKLFYLLGNLGRYCRRVMETGRRDILLEVKFEEQLFAWNPEHEDHALVDMSYAYRHHGLIMLYQVCGRPPRQGSTQQIMNAAQDSVCLRRHLALDSLKKLLSIPINAPSINFQSMPLLTAASELWQGDTKIRLEVVERFKAIYSTNRVIINLWAINLLEELWECCDSGNMVLCLELLLSKNWFLNFA
ncbi:fungal-specific transcription factor domain-containing protein [Dactylonectria macrodidyma]|uniref:Fungal-specific transcription factor domain-containing protein n=1 Tax=Dactylonectria macrodidyma TaxID=307937 RepID=A0A9P9DTG1_9HYPO|nr:fungal-specific transcription factor domain-containing protein [Dactylonectria macrodidyma]